MRILFVTSHYPHAPTYGAQLRVLNVGRQLKKYGEVSFIIVPSDKIDHRCIENTLKEFNVLHIAETISDRICTISDRIKHELDPSFLNTHYTSVSQYDQEVMRRTIDEFDVVWVHSVRTANQFRIYRWSHSVLDIDDIPSRIYMSRINASTRIIRRILDYRLLHIWKRREKILKHRFDVITVCSDEDRHYIGADSRVHVIHNGYDPPQKRQIHSPAIPARIGFIGLFTYEPNRHGIEWFVKEVWPRIKQAAPDTKLRLVGRESDKYFPMLGPDIDGLGYIEDAASEMSTWTAMIVPIWHGGGTRIKIAEAFSRMCPVVSTTLGAFGYDIKNDENILIADNPEIFAKACVKLIADKIFARRISDYAWISYLNNWTWDAIGESVQAAIEKCVKG